MESLLSVWIEKQVHDHVPLSKSVIQEKAKKLYEDLQSKYLPTDMEKENVDEIYQNFQASQGWFERFKVRTNLHIIQSGGCFPKQVFNVDETGLFWKRLPNRTYISKTEKVASGRKPSKNRLTLLLGGNAEGDFKFKPYLIFNSETPRVMKGVDKNRLPVHWRSNQKAWMTSALFKDWVYKCAIPEIRSYCSKANLDFKALIVLDNAPSHPIYIDDLSDNLKFIFIPPNTTSVIQPMDQGVISNFKIYYLRRTFKQLLNAIDGPEKHKIPEFWKNFNVMDAINNISES